ncbi:MAG: hypothetical protein AAGF83_07825 [Cyanobacteria bacterium P01_G01_bin.67]
MADELKKVNRQQQHLVNRAPEKLKRANKKQTTLSTSENIDTVDQGSKKWTIAGIVMAGVLVATAAGVGSQLKMLTRGKTAPQAAPSTAVNNAAPQAAVSQKQEQAGQMLLGQAKLLAAQGEPQQLAQAITLTQKLTPGVAVAPEAQSLSATWSQQIMEQATAEASAGKITEAIATANLIPVNSPQHQQAQQQAQQWQQQQAQAQEQQFAATLAEAARPIPLPPPVTLPAPAPLTTTPVAVNSTPTPAVAPQTQAESQPAPSVAPSSQQQAAEVKRPADGGKQGQSMANDPYLNVKIPQVTTPQVQSKAISSSAVALNSTTSLTGNSYGFGNMVAKAPTVAIQLRDNVDEDGDFVSLIVNGEVITRNEMIYNHGKVFMVDLLPGDNTVEIDGVKDGQGGITLEVNVAGVGNVNNTPIPEGSTASFIINREQ